MKQNTHKHFPKQVILLYYTYNYYYFLQLFYWQHKHTLIVDYFTFIFIYTECYKTHSTNVNKIIIALEVNIVQKEKKRRRIW